MCINKICCAECGDGCKLKLQQQEIEIGIDPKNNWRVLWKEKSKEKINLRSKIKLTHVTLYFSLIHMSVYTY